MKILFPQPGVLSEVGVERRKQSDGFVDGSSGQRSQQLSHLGGLMIRTVEVGGDAQSFLAAAVHDLVQR